MNKTIILCDFDGTITTEDIGDMVIRKYANSEAQKLLDQYYEGTLSLWETDSRIYTSIISERDEIQEYVRKNAIIRDGFDELLEFCRDKGIKFVIVSGGYDYYIEGVLGDRLENISCICNKTQFSSQGAMILPGKANPFCDKCGTCKRNICGKYRSKGYTIVTIGDSLSDYCMSEISDIRFARDRLKEHLIKLKKAHIYYDDFYQVIDHLR